MSTRNKVLHLIDTTGPGGAETIYLDVAQGLSARGWEPHMIVVGPGWVMDGIEARQLPYSLVETRGRFDVRYLTQLARLVRRNDASLIHAHLFSPAVYASLVGAWTGVPVITTFHGESDIRRDSLGGRIRHGLVERNSVVVCVSSALSARLQNPARATGRVIPNGIDVSSYRGGDGRRIRREWGINDDVVHVGAIGNIRPAKDYETLLRAFAALSGERQYALSIVGERSQPLYDELVSLRDALGLGERAMFRGFRSDIADVLASLDALVISSSSEGFSLSAIQGMAAGIPVVATRSGGPEEIITSESDGLLVPTGQPPELAAALQRVAESTCLRDGLVSQASRTVNNTFSMQAMLDAYEQLYLDTRR